jgi:ribosomal protein RSM22 (predicted rRNA methylase)
MCSTNHKLGAILKTSTVNRWIFRSTVLTARHNMQATMHNTSDIFSYNLHVLLPTPLYTTISVATTNGSGCNQCTLQIINIEFSKFDLVCGRLHCIFTQVSLQPGGAPTYLILFLCKKDKILASRIAKNNRRRNTTRTKEVWAE